jgi:hypothetical protein
MAESLQTQLASLGLPIMLLALGVSLFGVWRQKKWLPVIGAVLIVPFAWYLTSSSDFGLLAWLLPLSLLGAAFALHRGPRWLAWFLLLPLVGVFLLFVMAIFIWLRL